MKSNTIISKLGTVTILFVGIVCGMLFLGSRVNAEIITPFSYSVMPETVGKGADHILKGKFPSGLTSGGTISINFPLGSFDKSSIVPARDIDFLLDGVLKQNGSDYLVTSTSSGFTITTLIDIHPISEFVIKIGTNTEHGTDQIINPGSLGAVNVTISTSNEDNANASIPIISNTTVTITATVPSIVTTAGGGGTGGSGNNVREIKCLTGGDCIGSDIVLNGSGSIIFEGTSTPNQGVILYENGEKIGYGVADSNGHFVVYLEKTSKGKHLFVLSEEQNPKNEAQIALIVEPDLLTRIEKIILSSTGKVLTLFTPNTQTKLLSANKNTITTDQVEASSTETPTIDTIPLGDSALFCKVGTNDEKLSLASIGEANTGNFFTPMRALQFALWLIGILLIIRSYYIRKNAIRDRTWK